MKKTFLLAAALAATQATASFKCVDEKGRTHIGDTPPLGCANVVMYELNRAGAVVRTIEPSLSPEQIRQKQQEAARKAEADKVAAEQRRKDVTLLQTFSSEKEFDVVRDRNIEPLRGRIKAAQDRIAAVEKREKELVDELEFYKAGKSGKSGKAREAPKSLTDEQERLKAEKANLKKAIATHDQEIEVIRGKFDVDKKRWVALKAAEGRLPASAKK